VKADVQASADSRMKPGYTRSKCAATSAPTDHSAGLKTIAFIVGSESERRQEQNEQCSETARMPVHVKLSLF
jgi:hypothetical protein